MYIRSDLSFLQRSDGLEVLSCDILLPKCEPTVIRIYALKVIVRKLTLRSHRFCPRIFFCQFIL